MEWVHGGGSRGFGPISEVYGAFTSRFMINRAFGPIFVINRTLGTRLVGYRAFCPDFLHWFSWIVIGFDRAPGDSFGQFLLDFHLVVGVDGTLIHQLVHRVEGRDVGMDFGVAEWVHFLTVFDEGEVEVPQLGEFGDLAFGTEETVVQHRERIVSVLDEVVSHGGLDGDGDVTYVGVDKDTIFAGDFQPD